MANRGGLASAVNRFEYPCPPSEPRDTSVTRREPGWMLACETFAYVNRDTQAVAITLKCLEDS